jgi:hypothetical protein
MALPPAIRLQNDQYSRRENDYRTKLVVTDASAASSSCWSAAQ